MKGRVEAYSAGQGEGTRFIISLSNQVIDKINIDIDSICVCIFDWEHAELVEAYCRCSIHLKQKYFYKFKLVISVVSSMF